MRYVVVGAGGIGGVIGGRLAETGHEVVLVARGRHAEVLRRDGLRLALPERVVQLKIPTVERVAELSLQPQDALVLSVKSQQTAELLGELAAQPVGDRPAGQSLPLFCFQNGVSNELDALRYFGQVHGVCVSMPTTYLEPGRVEGQGSPISGILELGLALGGSDEADAVMAADLNASGFLATVREDVMAWKRAKLLRNLGNALEALFGRALSENELEAVRQLSIAAKQEGEACYRAAGLSVIDGQRWREHQSGKLSVKAVEGRERGGGSTWQSVVRGQGSVETDFLNGEIARLGRLHGVPTPVNVELQHRMWHLVGEAAEAGEVGEAGAELPSEVLAGLGQGR
ncbi:MAG: 2-dehydropantoate 2-reductase [Frankiales bacterium]|nr:2-dehydropantoate 2-reductase [Frankiales bacterium]